MAVTLNVCFVHQVNTSNPRDGVRVWKGDQEDGNILLSNSVPLIGALKSSYTHIEKQGEYDNEEYVNDFLSSVIRGDSLFVIHGTKCFKTPSS